MIGGIVTRGPITSARERTLLADNARSQPITPVWRTNLSAASHRGAASLHIDSAKDISRQPIAFHRTGDAAVYTAIQRVSHRGDQPSFFVDHSLRLLFWSPLKLALPRLSSDTRRCHSPMSTGGASKMAVPSRSSVQLSPLGVWLAWSGFAAPFSPSSLPTFLSSRQGVSEPRVTQPFIFTRCPPPGRRIRTPSGLTVYLHSLSAVGKVYPDREWSSRSSSLAIRRQEGASGLRLVQAFIFARLSATGKAYPGPEWSSRSSSLAIRRQEGVSVPRGVQPFTFSPIRRQGGVYGPPGAKRCS